jgi:hypothetical protein
MQLLETSRETKALSESSSSFEVHFAVSGKESTFDTPPSGGEWWFFRPCAK